MKQKLVDPLMFSQISKDQILKLTLNPGDNKIVPFLYPSDKSKIMWGVALDNFFEYQWWVRDNEWDAWKIIFLNTPS